MHSDGGRRDALYAAARDAHGAAIARLARAVERDGDRARDLEQDIHLALWRSLAGFAGECALSTWTFRVAHNVAASHASKGARGAKLVAIEEAAEIAGDDDIEHAAGEAQAIARLHRLIRALRPVDRSVILLWLEGFDAAAIGAVTGLSSGNVAVKIHRTKAALAERFQQGEAR